MTDWTTPEDVPTTTVERLHRWLLQEGNPEDAATPGERAVADIIRTFWPVPPRTLAEGLRSIREWVDWEAHSGFDEIVARAEEIEQERDDARTEVERLTAVNENLRRTGNYQEFREQFLTVQKGEESNAETLDPADVKPGEAWIVEVEGERRTAVKDGDRYVSWDTVDTEGCPIGEANHSVTLVTRLVPAPRVITNPDELDRLPRHTVILSTDGQADVYQKDSNGEWVDVTSHGYLSQRVIRMENAVTVLWEPGA